MRVHGTQLIGGEWSAAGTSVYRALNPIDGSELPGDFYDASDAQIDRAVSLAAEAFDVFRRKPPAERARLLRAIAAGIEALGDALIDRANAETALGVERLRGERGRTIAQLRLFADLIEEGSWVDARIDRAQPQRQPVPKPDLRRMLVPIGPVAVFGASNFPLAFSVAGGDTASALAAGCPVVVKVHPAHPGTSELVAGVIRQAVSDDGLPGGTFSMLHGRSPESSLRLVRHPDLSAVGFTGSLRAGRAIFDAAAARPGPIPVFAEMGSVNPLFLLPGAAAERAAAVAQGLKQSVTMGVGQFCTKPGVVVALAGEPAERFTHLLAEQMRSAPAGAMLHAAVHSAYASGLDELKRLPGVRAVSAADAGPLKAIPTVFATDADTFERHDRLGEELFGPSVVVVSSKSREQMLELARKLEGHLTATVHGSESDLLDFRDLLDVLQTKVGRVIVNGFPTGVEVCPSMQHGGPYPATTDPRTTSVGAAAIERFVRPVCFQNYPPALLPSELRDGNPLGLWRMVDGKLGKE